MKRRKEITGVSICLMDPLKIKKLSYGEVRSSETFNIKTGESIAGGLFCQKIFGPVKEGVCACGKYHKGRRNTVFRCDECEMELADPKVRRRRFGHIALASPVVHIWFREHVSTLLAIPPRTLDKVIACKAYVVVEGGKSGFKAMDIISADDYLRYISSGEKDPDFRADTGGAVLRHLLERLDLESLELKLKRAKPSRRVNKRLQTVRDFLASSNRPEWMVMETIPVLPPALRPILFLDDGTVASSDLNDLYAGVINRNSRLQRYISWGAPGAVTNMGKIMLQASVDALFDNGRRYTAMDRSGKRALKSLADLVAGKNGVLRKNLLGKRVDYSGRSVIVVGPDLKLHQCGLPLDLAMDIFKPFVYGRLLRSGYAYSLKHAKYIVESRRSEAVDALEEEIDEMVVLLNRAPSLHRMSIQAFYPVIVEGKAIKLHPLVCNPFNADFDGDQMGVHLPVTLESQIESRVLMVSHSNIISPANGRLAAVPAQDIVLGIYYLTMEKPGGKGEGRVFSDGDEALIALENGVVELQSSIKTRVNGEFVETTPGRLIFAEIFPPGMPFETLNRTIRKKDLIQMVESSYETAGPRAAVMLLEKVKELGFKYATLSGISLCLDDIRVPEEKGVIIGKTEVAVKEVEEQFAKGMMTEEERHNKIVALWMKASEEISERMMDNYGSSGREGLSPEGKATGREFNSIYMMADSGARGSIEQIRQVAGMRGLMAKPTGKIIEVPVKSSLKEGLTYHEFFLSAHGARKGRADGALKTANAGYFTRRLVDVAHDVIVNETDCGTRGGIAVTPLCSEDEEIIPIDERIYGRVAAADIIHPASGETIVRRSESITRGRALDIKNAGINGVYVRSPLACEAKEGVCAFCYGYDLSRHEMADIGEAVGVIAAQSIGEPGTQLTLRTFHTGGSASGTASRSSIAAKEGGIVKFEGIKCVTNRDGRLIAVNRRGRISVSNNGVDRAAGSVPYGATIHFEEGAEVQAGEILASWDPFNVPVVSTGGGAAVFKDFLAGVTVDRKTDDVAEAAVCKVTSMLSGKMPRIMVGEDEYFMPPGAVITVKEHDAVSPGDVIARVPKRAARTSDITGGLSRVLQLLEARGIEDPAVIAEISGTIRVHPLRGHLMEVEISGEDGRSERHRISTDKQMNFYNGDHVRAGEILVDGTVDPKDVLRALGREKAAGYVIDEIQKVYRGHGVVINDIHLEIMLGKMIGMVRITDPGETDFITGDIVHKAAFREKNDSAAGIRAKAEPVLLGITKAALESKSWLSAASFQRTSKVLADSAVKGKTDCLAGTKENVILGKLAPVGSGHRRYAGTVLKKRQKAKNN